MDFEFPSNYDSEFIFIHLEQMTYAPLPQRWQHNRCDTELYYPSE